MVGDSTITPNYADARNMCPSWDRIATHGESPKPRSGHTISILGRQAYLFGGCGISKDDSPALFDDLYCLDLNMWTWKSLKPAVYPAARRRHTMNAYSGSKLVLFGGEGKAADIYCSDKSKRLNDCWIFEASPDTIQWNQICFDDENPTCTAPQPRCHHSSVICNDKMWIFGGYGGSAGDTRSCLGDVCILDLQTKVYSYPNVQGRSPKPRAGHTACLIDNKVMMIAAGRDHGGMLDDCHFLHLETLLWSTLNEHSTPKMPLRVCNFLAFAIESVPSFKFFIFGGQTCSEKERYDWSYINDVRMLDLNATVWVHYGAADRSPTAREESAWAYDSKTAKLVLFGGWADEWLGDLFTMDVSGIVGPPYAVQGLDPGQGPITGGTKISVKGLNFYAADPILLKFTDGKYEETTIGEFISSTEISCLSPAWESNGAGVVDVRVSFGNEGFTVNRIRWEFYINTQPQKCLAFGLGLQPVCCWAVPLQFMIIAKDSAGRKRSSGLDPFRVEICHDAVGDIAAKVQDMKDGTYICTYLPKAKGRYTISVYLDDFVSKLKVPIRGSPWTVTAGSDPWIHAKVLGAPSAPLMSSEVCFCIQGRRLLAWGGSETSVHVLDLPSFRWDSPIVQGEPPPQRMQHAMIAVDLEKTLIYGGWRGISKAGSLRSNAQAEDSKMGDIGLKETDYLDDLYFLCGETIGWCWREGAIDNPKWATEDISLPVGCSALYICQLTEGQGSKFVLVADYSGEFPSDFKIYIFAVKGSTKVDCIELGSEKVGENPKDNSASKESSRTSISNGESSPNRNHNLRRCALITLAKDEILLHIGDMDPDKGCTYLGEVRESVVKWSKIPVSGDVPSPRHDFCMIGVDNKVLLYGGIDMKGANLDGMYSLDRKTWKWTCIYASDGDWLSRRKVVGVLDRRRLLIVSGIKGQRGDDSNDPERYDEIFAFDYNDHQTRTDFLFGTGAIITQILSDLTSFVAREEQYLDVNLDLTNLEDIVRGPVVLKVVTALYNMKTHMPDLETKMEIVQEGITLLEANHERIDNTRQALMHVANQLQQMKASYPLVKETIKPFRDKHANHLSSKISEFALKAMSYRSTFEKKPFHRYRNGPDESFRGIGDTIKEILTLEDELIDLTVVAEVFECLLEIEPAKNCLSDLKNKLRAMKQIWELIQLVESYMSVWHELAFGLMDAEPILEHSRGMLQQLQDCESQHKESDVYNGIHLSVSRFIASMSIISQLKHVSIKERHWKLVQQALKVTISLRAHATFKLKDMLRFEWSHIEREVQEIAQQAHEEEDMVKALYDIRCSWDGMEFVFDENKTLDIRFTFLTPDAVNMLEEHQIQIQTLLTSKYLGSILREEDTGAVTFGDEVSLWDLKLRTISNVVYLLQEIQIRWTRLHFAFSESVEIKQEMDEEAAKFQKTVGKIRAILSEIWEVRIVEMCCTRMGLSRELETIKEKFEMSESILSIFVDRKRKAFPRFYFVSTSDLVQLICYGLSPEQVMSSISKIIPAIASVRLVETRLESSQTFANSRCIGWISRKGEEEVTLSNALTLEGNVETYVRDFVRSAVQTVRQLLSHSVEERSMTSISASNWIFSHMQQVLLVNNHIYFTHEAAKAITDVTYREGSLQQLWAELSGKRAEFTETLSSGLSVAARAKAMAWFLQQGSFADLTKSLKDENVSEVSDFCWQSQLRFEWREDSKDCYVRIFDKEIRYDYEYVGNGQRLVITSTTNRVFWTAMMAILNQAGCALSGLNGTGKTEQLKELAMYLGKSCFVFNIEEGYDCRCIDRILNGMGASGSWICLDNLDRFPSSIMSVISAQIKSILNAVAAGRTTFNISGEELSLDCTCAVVATLEPGDVRRCELPDTMRRLFRTVAAAPCNVYLICEGILRASCFTQAEYLTKKLLYLYRLAECTFSQTVGYDWSMRSILCIVQLASKANSDKNFEEEEEIILAKAVLKFVTPRLHRDDFDLFQEILVNLFGFVPQPDTNQALKSKITELGQEANLHLDSHRISNVLHLDSLSKVRSNLLLLGDAGCGKSETWKLLLKTYKALDVNVCVKTVGPNMFNSKQFYGCVDESSGEWKDGVLSHLLRELSTKDDTHYQWLILDGEMDPQWIETLHPLLEDDRVLILASGERIYARPQLRVLFEISNLKNTSPGVTSTAGIVHLIHTEQWRCLITKWISVLHSEARVKSSWNALFERYVPPTLVHIQKDYVHHIAIAEVNLVMTLLCILDGLLYQMQRNSSHAESQYDKYERRLEASLVFACVWAFGSSLGSKSGMDYRKSFSNWWKTKWPRVKFPVKGTVFDYSLDSKSHNFVSWKSPEKQNLAKILGKQQFYLMSTETLAIQSILNYLIERQRGAVLIGAAGCGKSTILRTKVKLIAEEYQTCFVPFSCHTEAADLQHILDGILEKKVGNTFGPFGHKKLIVLIEDLHCPQPDPYGSQSAIALLRHYSDYGYWFDKSTFAQKNVNNMNILASANFDSRCQNMDARFQRHISLFMMDAPSTESLCSVFSSILRHHLQICSLEALSSDESFCNKIVMASLELRHKVTTHLKRSKETFHYEFNLRHVGQVMTGITQAISFKPAHFNSAASLAAFWAHESERVYSSYMVNSIDTQTFARLLKDTFKRYFKEHDQAATTPDSMLFGALNAGIYGDQYQMIGSWNELRQTLDRAIHEYNESELIVEMLLFEDTMLRICRLCRLIQLGNCFLVGTAACGKESLARLAVFIMKYSLINIGTKEFGDRFIFKQYLQNIIDQAISKEEPTVLLISSRCIIDQQFLVDVHEILSVDFQVPAFLGAEGRERLYSSMKLDADKLGVENSKEAVLEFCAQKIKSSLRVILTFCNDDSVFELVTQFPSMVRCTQLLWFPNWSDSVIESVSMQFLERFHIGPEISKELLSKYMSFTFGALNQLDTEYFNQEKRRCFVTPRSHLEFLAIYEKIFTSEGRKIMDDLSKFESAQSKFLSTSEKVVALEQELELKSAEVDEKKVSADSLVDAISAEQGQVLEQVANIQTEAAKCTQLASRCADEEAECARQLAAAEPALLAAERALNTLDKKDIIELKSLPNPPAGIEDVTGAILALRGEPPKGRDWNAAKSMMRDPASFIVELKALKTSIDDGRINAIFVESARPYLSLEHFKSELIEQKSKAVAGLCEFVMNIISYHDIVVTVEPKRKALRIAKEELLLATNKKTSLAEKIEELRTKIGDLEVKYSRVVEDKNFAVEEAEQLQKKVALAQRLTAALATAQVRWQERVTDLHQRLDNLMYDLLFPTTFVAYMGSLTAHFRQLLIQEKLAPFMQAQKMPASAAKNAIPILTRVCETVTFDLPVPSEQYEVSIALENELILGLCDRCPVLIDPDLTGLDLLCAREKSRKLKIESISSANLQAMLIEAIQFGWSLVIRNFDSDVFNSELISIISKRRIKKGSALVYTVSEREWELHPGFKLFLHTTQTSPSFSAEMQGECTLIYFEMTESELQLQLTSFVVENERLDLQSEATSSMQQIKELNLKKLRVQESILQKLADTPDDITNDQKVIEFFEQSHAASEEIEMKSIEFGRIAAKAEVSTSHYRPVAVRGCLLYSLLQDMHKVNSCYQYSLQTFVDIFNRSICSGDCKFGRVPIHVSRMMKSLKKNPYGRYRMMATIIKAGIKGTVKGGAIQKKIRTQEQRITELIRAVTTNVFDFISRGLLWSDQLLFAVSMLFRTFSRDLRIDPIELEHILTVKNVSHVPTRPEGVVSFISERAWRGIYVLQDVPVFSSLALELEANAERWILWCNSLHPEIFDLPGTYKNITKSQKLLMLRALRPDRVIPFLQRWISEDLGLTLFNHRTTEFAGICKDAGSRTPILFLQCSNQQMNVDVTQMITRKNFNIDDGSLSSVYLGLGHELLAEQSVRKAMQEGLWIILHNIQVVPQWSKTLENVLEEENVRHKQFRCFLTMVFDDQSAISQYILRNSWKIMLLPPQGLKANTLWEWKSLISYSSPNSSNPAAFRKLRSHLVLCFFHALVRDRQRFGFRGLSQVFNFDINYLIEYPHSVLCLLESRTEAGKDVAKNFEMIFGGQIAMERDRAILLELFQSIFHTFALTSEIFPGLKAILAQSNSVSFWKYVHHVECRVLDESPTFYGVNAEIEWNLQQCECLFDSLSVLAGVETVSSKDVLVLELVSELLDQLPMNINVSDSKSKIWTKEVIPHVNVFIQEGQRMNRLLAEIRFSLHDLKNVIEASLLPAAASQILSSTLLLGKVPEQWERCAYPSCKPLASWFVDLLQRVDQLIRWTEAGKLEGSVWISGLFNPVSQFLAVMQVECRKSGVALDKISLETKITNFPWEKGESVRATDSAVSLFIHGMYLIGARWDSIRLCLADQLPRDIHPRLPILSIKVVAESSALYEIVLKSETKSSIFECPVFRNPNNGFCFVIELPADAPMRKWITLGISLSLSVK